MSLKKINLSKVVEVSVNNKEENSEEYCLVFVQELGLRSFLLFVHSAFPSKNLLKIHITKITSLISVSLIKYVTVCI